MLCISTPHPKGYFGYKLVREYLRKVIFSVLLCIVSTFPAFAAPLVMPDSLPSSADKQAQALNRILTDINGQRAEVVAIQRELVARPALSPEYGGQGEEEKARWIESWLMKKNLPDAERFDVPDERVPAKVRPNLIIRYPGASPRTLWIVAHLDTSPPGDLAQWTGSPWALRFEGDMLYGRGVEDNHQAVASGLLLLHSLRRNAVTPPMSLGLLFTAGEKDGFPRSHGITGLLQAKPDIFQTGDLVVLNDYGNAQGSIVELSEKGLLWLKIHIQGKQTHTASSQLGINAFEAAAYLITDFASLYQRFPVRDPLFIPDVSTFSITQPEGGASVINQIPGEFTFHMDCRYLSAYTADEIQVEIRKLADTVEQQRDVKIKVEQLRAIPAFPGTKADAPVVGALKRAVTSQLGSMPKPVGTGGVTLATDLRAQGIPVVVWAKSDSMGHSPNERVSISALLDTAKVFARMLFDSQTTTETTKNTEPATHNATKENL